jgi:hypothetical protein
MAQNTYKAQLIKNEQPRKVQLKSLKKKSRNYRQLK